MVLNSLLVLYMVQLNCHRLKNETLYDLKCFTIGTVSIFFFSFKSICLNFSYVNAILSGAHGSVVMGVMPVTKRSLVQTPLWSLEVVCCAPRQGTLSTLSQSTQLKLGTGLCWKLINLRQTGVQSREGHLISPKLFVPAGT